MLQIDVIQLTSNDLVDHNLNTIRQCIQQTSRTGTHRLVVLPENALYFGPNYRAFAEAHFDNCINELRLLCQQHNIWLVAGTIATHRRPDGIDVPHQKVRAASICFNPQGDMVARYDKIHLFEAKVNDAIGIYKESNQFEAGSDLVVVPTPFGNLGLMVCFDLRFPLQALTLRKMGATIMIAPAAFTYTTGHKHWHLLNRARAMDTQSIVVAANQCGWHTANRQTYGHSMIVSADGMVLKEASEHQIECISTLIEVSDINSVRNHMPNVGIIDNFNEPAH